MEAILETLTPVHVGNGISYTRNIDFIRAQNRIGIIDEKKVLGIIGQDKIQQWTDAINKGGDSFIQLLKNRGWNNELEKVCSKMIRLRDTDNTSTILKEHYYTALLGPCIPGSSIKGAIRTAIFNTLADTDFLKSFPNEKLKNYKGKLDDAELLKNIFGDNPNESSMRFLKIGDAIFPNQSTEAHEIRILNAYHEEWAFKEGQQLLVETIPAGRKASFNFKIDHLLQKRNLDKNPSIWKGKNSYFNNLSITDFCKQLNNFTKNQLGFDINNLIEETFEDGESYLENLNDLFELCENAKENEMILRVGGHSGYLFMTGQWMSMTAENSPLPSHLLNEIRKKVQRNREYDMDIWPKTRKITSGEKILGFVKIKISETPQEMDS